MTREEYENLAKNNPIEAMMHLFDDLQAAELNQAVILGAGGDQTEAE